MKETLIPAFVVGGVFLLILIIAAVWVAMGGDRAENQVLEELQEQGAPFSNMDENNQGTPPYQMAPGLTAQDIVEGEGAAVASGQTVAVKYVGMLENGQVFDSSDAHGGQPFTFTLGGRQVIQGWDMGVVGMKPGGVRILTIAPELAYGDREIGGGAIPANSTLVFRVEMIGPVQ